MPTAATCKPLCCIATTLAATCKPLCRIATIACSHFTVPACRRFFFAASHLVTRCYDVQANLRQGSTSRHPARYASAARCDHVQRLLEESAVGESLQARTGQGKREADYTDAYGRKLQRTAGCEIETDCGTGPGVCGQRLLALRPSFGCRRTALIIDHLHTGV